MGTSRGFFPLRDKFQGGNLTTNLHPALKMLGTIYLLSLCVFVAWTGADLHSSLYLPVASCGLIIISKMQTFSNFQICGKLQSCQCLTCHLEHRIPSSVLVIAVCSRSSQDGLLCHIGFQFDSVIS